MRAVPLDTTAMACAWVRVAALPEDEAHQPATEALWSNDIVRRAVALASPVLSGELDKILATDGLSSEPAPSPARRTKALRALRAYHSRMSTRPTPSGAMAAVYVAQLDGPNSPATADLAFDLTSQSEHGPTGGVHPDDVLAVSPAVERMPTGLLVPPVGSLRGLDGLRHMTVSPSLHLVLEMCTGRTPRAADLVRALAERGSDEPTWWSYLRRLERIGAIVVLTDPRRRASAEVHSWSATDRTDPASSVRAVATGATGSSLPSVLRQHAEQMVALLDLVNPPREYPAHLSGIATMIRHRFGVDAQVPLDDAFSALHGVHLAPPLHSSPPSWTDRDTALAELLDTATEIGAIELTAPRLSALASLVEEQRGLVPPVPAQEVALRPVATPEGCRSELVFVGSVGALGARFLHLVSSPARAQMLGQVAAAAAAFGSTEVAGLVSAPRRSGTPVWAISPVVDQHEVTLSLDPANQHAGPWLSAREVLIGSSESTGRLVLTSARTGRRLHVVATSMAVDALMSPLDRLVLEISRSQYRHARPFDWGALSRREHLPRISVGSVDLSPRRWRVSREALGNEDKLRAFWKEHDVPAHVSVRPIGSDQALPLDRDDHHDLRHVARRARATHLELRCLPEHASPVTDEDGRSHVVDVVVPVITGSPVASVPHCPAPSDGPSTARAADRVGPGEVISWDLRLPQVAVRPFLADTLTLRWPEFHTSNPGLWYEVDGGTTVRLCAPADDAAAAVLLGDIGTWAWSLRRDGLLAEASLTELHGQRRSWCHLFSLDSRHALDVLATHAPGSPELHVEAAVAAYRLLTWVHPSPTTVRPLLRACESSGSGALYRSLSAEVYHLSRQPMPASWGSAATAALQASTDAERLALAQRQLARFALPPATCSAVIGLVRRLLDRQLHSTSRAPEASTR